MQTVSCPGRRFPGISGAGGGNRTRVFCLEGRGLTITQRPQWRFISVGCFDMQGRTMYRNCAKDRLINAFGCAGLAPDRLGRRETGYLAADFVASCPPLGRPGGFRADLPSCHQPSSHQKQVAEGEQVQDPGAVAMRSGTQRNHTTHTARQAGRRDVIKGLNQSGHDETSPGSDCKAVARRRSGFPLSINMMPVASPRPAPCALTAGLGARVTARVSVPPSRPPRPGWLCRRWISTLAR